MSVWLRTTLTAVCRTYDVPLPNGWLGQSAGDTQGTEETAEDQSKEAPDGEPAACPGAGSKERTDKSESAATGAPPPPDAPREGPPPAAPAAPTTAPDPAPSSASTDWNSLMDRFAALKRR